MGLFSGRRRRSSDNDSSSGIPFVRFVGPGFSIAAFLGLIFFAVTGRIDLSTFDDLAGRDGGDDRGELQPVRLSSLSKSPDTIRIATFHIQMFGDQKSSDQEVIAVIAKIVSQFDVIAIQEVRSDDALPIRRLVDLLNASGGRFTATVSEPIGRSNDRESYAYVWDETRIRLIPQSAYVVNDQADRMNREPMVASFQVNTGTADGRVPFRFTLINAHTSPIDVAAGNGNELDVLDDVFVSVRQYDYESTGEEDCILLGDLGTNTEGLRQLGQIPDVTTIAGDIRTSTIGNQTFDHILIDRRLTREFTGRFGVLDFPSDFGLTAEQASKISDHLPLWAEFSAYELPRIDPIAASGTRVIR
jgi:endonuclease/exonuclease/phosphatase family metal-dependent hydrolase